MVIIGGGNLGRALAGYANFESRGFVVKGIFAQQSGAGWYEDPRHQDHVHGCSGDVPEGK